MKFYQKLLNIIITMLSIFTRGVTCEKDGDSHPIPIELLQRIDIISEGKDGSIILTIVSAGYLDNSSYTEKRILDKINTYLNFINDEEFEKRFGKPSVERTLIKLTCNTKPHPYVLEIINSIELQVKKHNSSIKLKFEE